MLLRQAFFVEPQPVRREFIAGINNATNSAMIAITTSSSVSVNARRVLQRVMRFPPISPPSMTGGFADGAKISSPYAAFNTYPLFKASRLAMVIPPGH